MIGEFAACWTAEHPSGPRFGRGVEFFEDTDIETVAKKLRAQARLIQAKATDFPRCGEFTVAVARRGGYGLPFYLNLKTDRAGGAGFPDFVYESARYLIGRAIAFAYAERVALTGTGT